MSDLTSLEIGVFVVRRYVPKVDVSLGSKKLFEIFQKYLPFLPLFFFFFFGEKSTLIEKYITYA